MTLGFFSQRWEYTTWNDERDMTIVQLKYNRGIARERGTSGETSALRFGGDGDVGASERRRRARGDDVKRWEFHNHLPRER